MNEDGGLNEENDLDDEENEQIDKNMTYEIVEKNFLEDINSNPEEYELKIRKETFKPKEEKNSDLFIPFRRMKESLKLISIEILDIDKFNEFIDGNLQEDYHQ